MKLFLSTKLQKQLGRKCEKAPTPDNRLDRWYANLIELSGADTLVAMLPDFRFCVIIWNIQLGPSTDLSKLLVSSIRDALQDPYYGIPLSVIDQYIPEDTQFELCTSGDRTLIYRMRSTVAEIQSRGNWFAWLEGNDPATTPYRANRGYVDDKGDNPTIRWQAVKEELLRQYGRSVPAMELEITLDLLQYAARRTLIVSEEATFNLLSEYLQLSFSWRASGQHHFILPAAGDRDLPLIIYAEDADLPDDPNCVREDNYRLSELLQTGDRFCYLYTAHGNNTPWGVDIRVRRRFITEEALPICTLCEGKAPPAWVNGLPDFQEFCQILENPKDPRYLKLAERVGTDWAMPADAKHITSSFRWIDHTM